MKNTICTLVAAAMIGLSGCSGNNEASGNNESTPKEVTHPPFEYLVGKPISVETDSFRCLNTISVVIQKETEEYVLASCSKNYMNGYYTDAHAIIKSEINDGDNQYIEMKGKYSNGRFTIYEVSANDLTAVLISESEGR